MQVIKEIVATSPLASTLKMEMGEELSERLVSNIRAIMAKGLSA
jgi:hypothetical protein